MKVYQVIANKLAAMRNCNVENDKWYTKHELILHKIVKEYLPSGSGFDNDTGIWNESCTKHKLVFESGYHMMSEHGFYIGWIEFYITVYPEFTGIDMRIKYHAGTKKKYKDLHTEFILDQFHYALNQEIDTEKI